MPAGIPVAFELWSDFANSFYGGVKQAALRVTRWQLLERIADYLVSKELTLTLPLAEAGGVVPGAVIRTWFRDATVTPVADDWEEYRILTTEADGVTRRMTVVAEYWLRDLADARRPIWVASVVAGLRQWGTGYLRRTDGAGFCLDALTDFVPSAAWASGVVPTTQALVRGDGLAILQLLSAYCQAVEADTGVRNEISARRNGTAGIYVDIGVTGTGVTFDVRPRKNLRGLQLRYSRPESATVITFGPGDLNRPTYKVSAVSAGAYIEVVDLLGARGPGRADDQWNTLFEVVEWKNGTRHTITDTVYVSSTTTRFHIASTTGIATNDLVWLQRIDENPLDRVEAIAAATSPRPVARTMDASNPVTNFIFPNSDMDDWTGTDPAGWTHGGTAPTKTTGLSRYGRYVADCNGGVGVTSMTPPAVGTLRCEVNEYLAVTVFFIVAVHSGSIFRFTNPNTGATEDYTLTAANSPVNVYQTYTRAWQITGAGGKTTSVVLLPVGGRVYWDAVQVSHHITDPGQLAEMVKGSGSARNVARANTRFDQQLQPVASVRAAVADLQFVAPRDYGDDRPVLGATGYFTSPDHGLTRAPMRVVSVRRTSGDPANPEIELATPLARYIQRALRGY